MSVPSRSPNWIGCWVLFLWFVEKGEKHVAPDDRLEMERLRPYGRLFYCRASEGPYAVLDLAGRTFRVTPHLLRKVPEPAFAYGEAVKLVADSSRSGTIREIRWHFKERREFYQITEDGRSRNRRFWAVELIASDGQ